MKVLIVSFFYPPLRSVASHRPESLAQGFAGAGHNVTVLTAPIPASDYSSRPVDSKIQIVEADSFLLRLGYRFLSFGRKANSSDNDAKPSFLHRILARFNRFRDDGV